MNASAFALCRHVLGIARLSTNRCAPSTGTTHWNFLSCAKSRAASPLQTTPRSTSPLRKLVFGLSESYVFTSLSQLASSGFARSSVASVISFGERSLARILGHHDPALMRRDEDILEAADRRLDFFGIHYDPRHARHPGNGILAIR